MFSIQSVKHIQWIENSPQHTKTILAHKKYYEDYDLFISDSKCENHMLAKTVRSSFFNEYFIPHDALTGASIG